jgi:hypothetical protein
VFISGVGKFEFSVYTIESVRVRPAASKAASHVYRFAPGPPRPAGAPGDDGATVVGAGETLRFPGIPAWRCQSMRQPVSFRCSRGTDLLLTVGADGHLTVSSKRPAAVSGPVGDRAYIWS